MEERKTELEIINERKQKLNLIREEGINPYPSKGLRTHYNEEAHKNFSKLNGKKVAVVGRIMGIRAHGKLSFATIKDSTAQLQLVFKEDILGKKGYKFLRRFDRGDFIGAKGKIFKTKAGEISVEVSAFEMLSKALRPLPEKFHGLKDPDLIYRKRYLDYLLNDESKNKIIKRSETISAIREGLTKAGFMEIQFPVLESVAAGAAAKPFKTEYKAYGVEVYLRIAIELWQKMIMVGGFEKTFEMGKVFRNEGVDREHNPEFTLCEFYWAYADYKDQMKFTEKLISGVAKKVTGSYKTPYQGKIIDFKPPYQKITFKEAMKKYAKIDIESYPDKESLAAEIKKRGFKIDAKAGRGKLLDDFYKEAVRPKLLGPLFLTEHPLEVSPLDKSSDKGDTVERFQLLINGFEVCNAYSELNDPTEQRERFKEQQKLAKGGDEEAQRSGEGFVEAMEYGMPPIAGNGIGIERLVMLLTDSPSVREITPFPFMKPQG